MEKVSILMPSYNHEPHLKEAIESCLSQTYKNIELLIADNSTDNSWRILDEYRNDQRVRIFIRDDPWPLTKKLNFLIDEAKGDYIKLFYSDDVMIPDFIEKCINFAKEYDLDFVHSDHALIDYNGNVFNENEKKIEFNINKKRLICKSSKNVLNYFVKFGSRGPFTMTTLFGKRDSVKRIGKFNENFTQEDVILVFKMHILKFKHGYINEPLWKFRIFNKSNMNPIKSQKTEDHYNMRIYSMKLALKSELLNKETKKIAKKRIMTYKAEIFQSKYRYMGLFGIFYTRYQPLLVKYYLIFQNKKINFKNYLDFIINDFYKRVKMARKGISYYQRYY